MNTDYTKINNWLKENLCAERYEHSLGVAECAAELAEKFSLDKDKAYLTGLIHDCAKCLPEDKTLEILTILNIPNNELSNPKIHHAPVGAYIAKKNFGILDKEILSAIRWHTLGNPNMTIFEKIIFLADKIEKRTREQSVYQPIQDVLNSQGIDAALLMCYKNTIKSLVDRNLKICPVTLEIYNSLINTLE